MIDPAHPIAKLLESDRRYKLDAYVFVFEALGYAHKVLGMGGSQPSDEGGAKEAGPKEGSSKRRAIHGSTSAESPERHLTGQQLCEAIRLYGLDQFGYMAKCVLNSWGVHNTGDFGEIVFNLIRIGQMKKTNNDRREDFDDVFDFDAGLQQSFKIVRPEA